MALTSCQPKPEMKVQTLTVQGRLATGGNGRPAKLDETVDTPLQLFAVRVGAETVVVGATVQVIDGVRARAFALCYGNGQHPCTNHWVFCSPQRG